jgi:cytochrome c oxidase cbb3-type subunit III
LTRKTNQKTQTAMNNPTKIKTLVTLVATALALPVMAQGAAANSADNQLLYGLLIGLALLFLVIMVILNNAIKSIAANKELWSKRAGKGGAILTTLLFVMSGTESFAISPETPFIGVFAEYPTTFWVLVGVNIFLAIIIITQLRIFKNLIEALKEPEVEELPLEVQVVEEAPGFMEKVMAMLTKSVPVEEEEDVLTDHEYDGIRELDNVLPPWWVAMFYATIIFSFVYLIHYHVIGTGDLQIAEYENDVIKADAQVAAFLATQEAQVDENTVTLITDASRLASGEKIYVDNCVACHGVYGEGGVGPNFADQYWVHGGTVNDLFRTIKYGVPAKGMISWKNQLSPAQMQDVASYILTFQGTSPANPKAPEGELYIPSEVVPVEVIKSDSILSDSVVEISTAEEVVN